MARTSSSSSSTSSTTSAPPSGDASPVAEGAPAGDAPAPSVPPVVDPAAAVATPVSTPAPVAAPVLDVDEISRRIMDGVLGVVGPAMRRMEKKLHELEAGAIAAAQDEDDDPLAGVPEGEIADGDLPYLAKNLTPAQFDRLLALRQGTDTLKLWADRGAQPGVHVIAGESIKITYAGKARNVAEGDVLEIALIAPKEHEELRKAGLLLSPGDAASKLRG